MNTSSIIPPLAHQPAAVIFDLGRVMVYFDYHRAATGLARHSQMTAQQIQDLIDQSPLLMQLETGQLTNQEFFESIVAATGFRESYGVFARIFGDIFDPVHEMIEIQSRLVERGIPTYAFSNTNGIAVAHIDATYPFFRQFTDRICSHDHKSMKPNAPIYEALERATGRRGADLLYLDDRLENIEAGAARGWQTIHVTHAPSAAQELARRMGV